MEPRKINFRDKLARLPGGDYAVRIIARMNDYEFKIVKFKGEFVWHRHPDTDETFILLEGRMRMDFRTGAIELGPGEMIVVPRGAEHRPASREGYKAILIEPRGVSNTGDVESAATIREMEWI
jgi:mannose-6-phosphate isomerase-like protein (cupin superfamily)